MFKLNLLKPKTYASDEGGNISIMFAGALSMVLAVVAVAVETTTLHNHRIKLQDQLDAAILAVVVSGLEKKQEQIEHARNFIKSNGYELHINSLDIKLEKNSEMVISGHIQPETAFSKFLGYDPKVATLSAVSVGESPDEPVDLVLVLDTTESMDGRKMNTLKTAARNLVDNFPSRGEIKVSVVPFSNYVNVGIENRNAWWMEVGADRTETYEHTHMVTVRDAYCRSNGESIRVRDGVAYTSSGAVCHDYVPAERVPGATETRTRVLAWRGCARSRHAGHRVLHLEDGDYANYKIVGHLDAECAQPLLPLTDDMNAVKSKISSLVVDRDTYMPAGIMWGRRVLSPQEPFSGGRSTADARKIMVLMTDGQNSMHRWGSSHNRSDPKKAQDVELLAKTNADTETLCTLAKAEETEIFSIAFEVDDTSTRQMLERCASNRTKFFDASNSAQLIKAFEDIAETIQMTGELRITR